MNLLENPAYFALWPEWLDKPASVTVIKDKWDPAMPGFVDPHTLEEYPEDYGMGPGISLVMPNGATYKLQYIDPYTIRTNDVSYTGNWDYYLNGDSFALQTIRDAVERALHLVTIHRHEEDQRKKTENV